jgi:hypothetical protein
MVYRIYSRVPDGEIGDRNGRGIETQENMAPEIWRGRRRGRTEFGVHKFHCEWVGDKVESHTSTLGAAHPAHPRDRK